MNTRRSPETGTPGLGFRCAPRGHRHDADVWIDGAEGIILRRRFVRSGDGIEKRGFPDVRQSDYSSAEHKVRRIMRTVGAVYDRPQIAGGLWDVRPTRPPLQRILTRAEKTLLAGA